MDDWRGRLAGFPGAVVVCLGNEYRGDDGAGLEVCRLLRKGGFGGGLVEAGRNLLSALPEIEGAKARRLLLVDAADMGLEAGAIAALEEDEISERGLSTHENNLAMALGYLRGKEPGLEVLYLGMQFESVEMTDGMELGVAVQGAVREIVDFLLNEYEK